MTPSAIQTAAWRHASSSTQRPIGTIRPERSASGMKSSGGTSSPSRRQRISASTPNMTPVGRSSSGW